MVLQSRRSSEEDEDLNTSSTRTLLYGSNPLEAQMGSEYTRNFFYIFQDEFKKSQGCMYKKIGQEDLVTKYKVSLYGNENKKHLVCYQCDGKVVATCKKFEGERILCLHILRIFWIKHLMEIPKQYILHQWTIGARHVSLRQNEDNNNINTLKSGFTQLDRWTFRSALVQLEDLGTSFTREVPI